MGEIPPPPQKKSMKKCILEKFDTTVVHNPGTVQTKLVGSSDVLYYCTNYTQYFTFILTMGNTLNYRSETTNTESARLHVDFNL